MDTRKGATTGKASAKAAKKEKQASKAAKKEAAAIKATTKGKGKGPKEADDEEDLDAILDRYKAQMEAVSISMHKVPKIRTATYSFFFSLRPTLSRHWRAHRRLALALYSSHRRRRWRQKATTCT